MTTLTERIRDAFRTAREFKGIGIAELRVDKAVELNLLPKKTAKNIVQGLWRLMKKNKGDDLTGRWK